MDVRKLFTQQLNYRYVDQLIDKNIFAGVDAASQPEAARVMFEGRGVQIVRITLPKLHGEAEKACIRALRKRYPDAVYLFADAKTDTDKTAYHLCNDAGKQLPLAPEQKLLFTDKVKFFEVTDDLTGTLDLKERIAKAFETEKITKRFYNEFKNYREKLMKFIKGIPLEEERSWYASVLLNRLMFIYFIQKRGFINQDENWLRAQLAAHEQAKQPFYTGFLVPLFFSGFDKRPGERGAHEAAFAGVPYLNGGLFQKHPIEERHDGEISIDNKVLRELLDYFDRYRWYLDDRELRDENEINPDVLGFIFEKYVNQKQMGAYYTKEDITGYICRNTILPFLLTKLANAAEGQPAPLPFPIDDENIERYIYDAVKTPEYLPTETAREYAARQKRFAGLKADAGAGKIAAVNDLITFNLDIVTYADDAIAKMDERALKRFYFEGLFELTVLDPTCGSGAFLFAALNILLPLYTACLQRMKGFAEGMKDAGHKAARAGLTNEYSAFQKELRRIAEHDNLRYYIIKTIIVNNLYGVDIMEEATEICKLRLFLRLASEIKDPSQIEPLPDIDFNIKAGNTLVGFANRDDVARALSTQQRVKDGQVAAQNKMFSGDALADDAVAEVEHECADADREFKFYREMQTMPNASARDLAMAKHNLRSRMKALNDTLDRALAREYGVALPNEQAEASTKAGKRGKAPLNTLGESAAFVKWKDSHQPFHWFAEFYGILVDKGGFDVIVGNPPYVEYSSIANQYLLIGFNTKQCGNIYAPINERSTNVCKQLGFISFIIPVSSLATDRMKPLQHLQKRSLDSLWFTSYTTRPAKLFDGADQRLTILIGRKSVTKKETDCVSIYAGKYMRWYTQERSLLLDGISYQEISELVNFFGFIKISTEIEKGILAKLPNLKLGSHFDDKAKDVIYWHRIPQYFIKSVDFIPYFRSDRDGEKKSEDYKEFRLRNKAHANSIIAVLNSSIFYWYWFCKSEGYHCGKNEILSFPFNPDTIENDIQNELNALSMELMKDLKKNSKRRIRSQATTQIEYDEFYLSESKSIIDRIDRVLAKHYGFTDEELDFIIHYDIKYRMGRDAEAEDE